MPITPSQGNPFTGEPPLITGRNRDTLNAMAASCGEFEAIKSSLVSVIKRGDFLDEGGGNLATYEITAITADPSAAIQWRYSAEHVSGQDFGEIENQPVYLNAVKPFEVSALAVGKVVLVVDMAGPDDKEPKPEILMVEANVPGGCPPSGASPAAVKREGMGGLNQRSSAISDFLLSKATASAPGSNTQIAFNDAGTLAGDAGLTWDKTNDLLRVAGSTSTASINVKCNASDTAFKMQSGAGDEIFAVGATGSNANLSVGDLDETGNHCYLTINDTDPATGFVMSCPGGTMKLGDPGIWSNGSILTVDDANQVVTSNVPVDFQQHEAKQMRIENRTSDPASPAVGEIWLRTDL